MPRLAVAFIVLATLVQSAFAGPPYLSDDPEPTDYKHYEIYTFNDGTSTRAGTDGETGIDFNYGAVPNLQLTATLPLGFAGEMGGASQFGLSNIELAAKYRFLQQSQVGWDVAVFPRLFLPSPSNVGDKDASVLLPIWLQRDLGNDWTTFGGGGCQLYADSAQDSCMAGWVLTHKFTSKLELGLELFHQTPAADTPASTSLGLGAVYDLNETFHLLGYVRTGLENRDETDRFGWYGAVLFTF
jgi:hypothetical protein